MSVSNSERDNESSSLISKFIQKRTLNLNQQTDKRIIQENSWRFCVNVLSGANEKCELQMRFSPNFLYCLLYLLSIYWKIVRDDSSLSMWILEVVFWVSIINDKWNIPSLGNFFVFFFEFSLSAPDIRFDIFRVSVCWKQ